MSWKALAGKGTWWGALAAVVVLTVLLGLEALLLLRGVLPENSAAVVVCVSAAVSCCVGGRLALRWGSGGTVPRALAVSGCVYALMWLASLAGEAGVCFDSHGMLLTACVWGGGLLAGLTGSQRRKRKPSPRRRREAGKARRRAVT